MQNKQFKMFLVWKKHLAKSTTLEKLGDCRISNLKTFRGEENLTEKVQLC